MNHSFTGKVVLVTGANSGIGEAAALAFVEAGATVYGLARREEAIAEQRKNNPKIHWVRADVTDSKAVDAALAKVLQEAGQLDVLVNNAAVFTFAPLGGSTDEMTRRQFEANVYGPLFVSRAALPALTATRGSIVNVGSAAGHMAIPNGSVYAATKAAVESFTRSWALELAPVGVRVNAIAPGPTDTPGFEKDGATPEQAAAVKAAFTAQVPLGRMASSAEIAQWIVLLANPTATFLTGQILSVDGAMSL